MRTCHAILHIWWRSVQSFIEILLFFLLSLPCGLLSSGFGADGKGSWKIRWKVRLRWLRLCSAQVFLSCSEPYVILKYDHQSSSHSLKLSLVWSINGFWKLKCCKFLFKEWVCGEGRYCYSVIGIDRGFNLHLLAVASIFVPQSWDKISFLNHFAR